MAEKKEPDLERIKELIEIMKENNLAEVEIKHGDDKIVLKRCQPQQPGFTAVPMVAPNVTAGTEPGLSKAEPAAVASPEADLLEIKSPLVGTFYATGSPDSEPFVEVNSPVEPQTVVCIIEAMKVMNEIKAEVSGTIAQILVTSGQAVEYGQALFRVKLD